MKKTLIFEENFQNQTTLNPDIWNYDIGDKWHNNESQCYVEDTNNLFIKDGILNIKATLNNSDTCRYKSARINTFKKKHFQYGTFVFTAKMPKGRGAWPAIWMLGADRSKDLRWPKCGEIDIVEFAGNRPLKASCAIHTATYNHRIDTDKGVRYDLLSATDQFHDYILDWTKDHLIFKVDDKEVFRVEKEIGDTENEWPFDKPYDLIINLAVGGWYGGKIHDEDLPYLFQIKSIKVYSNEDTV